MPCHALSSCSNENSHWRGHTHTQKVRPPSCKFVFESIGYRYLRQPIVHLVVNHKSAIYIPHHPMKLTCFLIKSTHDCRWFRTHCGDPTFGSSMVFAPWPTAMRFHLVAVLLKSLAGESPELPFRRGVNFIKMGIWMASMEFFMKDGTSQEFQWMISARKR